MRSELFQIHSESMIMCLILMILLLIMEFRTRNRNVWQKYILPMYIIVMVELVIDAVWFVIDGRSQFICIHKIIQTIYLCLYPVLGWTWLSYCATSFNRYQLLEKRWYKVLMILTIAINTILVILSWNAGLIYIVDEMGIYSRGPLIFITNGISYATMIIAAVLSVIESFYAKSITEKKKYLIQAAYVLPVLIMGLAQLILPPGVTSAYFGFVITFAMILVTSLDEQITQDSLTGLLNQRTIDKKVNDEIAHYSKGDRLYLAVIDIDRFKKINDTYGHSVGDEVLRQVGESIRDVGNLYDADVSRIHGDEFVVFIKDCDEDEAVHIMEEIVKQVEVDSVKNKRSIMLTISYGLAQFVDGMTEKLLFEVADRKLYEQKKLKHTERTV